MDGYTEYGYRGLEEIKQKEKIIEKLREEVSKLKGQLQVMENRCTVSYTHLTLPTICSV